METGFATADGFMEGSQHLELLAAATTKIDELGSRREATEQFCDWLDWLAFLTREHFGLQLRLLQDCSQQREYLLDRVAVQHEFRRRLADLCIDAVQQDRDMLERFREVCHDILADTQSQHTMISDLMRSGTIHPKLRRGPRKGDVVANPWL
jgi:hypothetical protein